MKKNELNELKNLLEYLQDKVENCYKKEVEVVIKEYLDSFENA